VLRQAIGFTGRSWMVAALFALHPINVESVAWISERKNLLSTCFGLLCLWAYVRYAERAEGKERKSEDRNPKTEGKPKPEILTWHSQNQRGRYVWA
jgi:hypothetical protein